MLEKCTELEKPENKIVPLSEFGNNPSTNKNIKYF